MNVGQGDDPSVCTDGVQHTLAEGLPRIRLQKPQLRAHLAATLLPHIYI